MASRSILGLPLIFLAAIAACGKTTAADQPPPPPPLPESPAVSATASAALEIRLERRGCYVLCPVYTVTLASDGVVTYEGSEFVGTKGRRTRQIPRAEVEALAKKLESEGFFTMSWKDPCKDVVYDLAKADVTLVAGGRSRTIFHDHGNRCVPEKLIALEDEIDRVARVEEWTRCDGRCER